MSVLADALGIQGDAIVVSIGERTYTARSVLDQAALFNRAIDGLDGGRILSLDPSPATLLALLVLAERYNCQLILGRPSINVAALGEMLSPDIIVYGADRIEKHGDGQSARRESGIFLLTSGTTGTPKVVHQTLPALLGRVQNRSLGKNRGAHWLLTYETHSFAGLQVVLSAALSDSILVAAESLNPAALLQAARRHNVTHISGTPTFSRALLMAVKDEGLPMLRQFTLGGEAVDQATLDRVSRAFPSARVSHIYASTEAGALFAVHDGQAGFPSAWLGQTLPGGVMLRISEGVLEVRSPRRMLTYASGQRVPLTEDGWLVTGDLVRVRDDRVLFCGRQDEIVNIAGLKVSPEEVEAFLLAQPAVHEAQVFAVPSPLTGSLLAARIVVCSGLDPQKALDEVRAACGAGLPRHKVPRHFELVEALAMSSSGKKAHTS